MIITKELVSRILSLMKHGLVCGLGEPVPGKMCIEALICFALGLPHGDDPPCVAQSLRELKIKLNDSNWSTNIARAKGLQRLGIAQLGTSENFNETEFAIRVALINYKEPSFVKWAKAWLDGTDRTEDAAYAARCAARYAAESAEEYAAEYTARYDKILAEFAEQVVQILITMKVPAVEFLPPYEPL